MGGDVSSLTLSAVAQWPREQTRRAPTVVNRQAIAETAADGPSPEQQRLESRERAVLLAQQRRRQLAGEFMRPVVVYRRETGPDGRLYATGAKVQYDLRAVHNNPQQTLEKALSVRRAALLPGERHIDDLRVAAQASIKAHQARLQLARQSQGAPLQMRPAAQALNTYLERPSGEFKPSFRRRA